jgi:hypothetical protein
VINILAFNIGTRRKITPAYHGYIMGELSETQNVPYKVNIVFIDYGDIPSSEIGG